MPAKKMPAKKPTNPLYFAALPAGVLFAITACAFVVMTIQGGDPQRADQAGLIGLLDRHGVMILVVELATLGILTMGAILTDDFWTRRFETANEPREVDGIGDSNSQ